jgi:peptidoglycan/xylan/chitin deacetylase (PgdA/CDA1 family)
MSGRRMSGPRRRLWFGVVLAVLVLSGSAAAASDASGGERQALVIQSASLTQDGQQLVWHVQLAQPFAASRLAGQHRSLCLLIERVASGVVWGEACVVRPGRHSSETQLDYMTVSGGEPGPAELVSATVTRPDPEDLTATFLPGAVDLRYGPIRWQTRSTLNSDRCESGCSARYPTRSTLLKMHTPVLVGCVAHGPSLVYQGPADHKEIALTFDDGPWDDPPSIDFVRMLAREHVPATFFEIGRQIAPYDPTGAVQREMLADGDMIGDHSWSHPNVAALPASKQRAQLLDAAAAIKHATGGFTPCLWRPPYGAISPSLIALARSLGFLTIMWDVDPRDWALPGVGAIYSNVVDNAHNGAIVIQHFGGGPRFETLAAVPREITTLRARGYTFVTVAQLLGLQLVYR